MNITNADQIFAPENVVSIPYSSKERIFTELSAMTVELGKIKDDALLFSEFARAIGYGTEQNGLDL